MTQSPYEVFHQRAVQFTSDEKIITKKSENLSLIRIVLFLVSTALIIYFLSIAFFTAFIATTLISTLLFIYLVNTHNKVKFKKSLLTELRKVNEEELTRLKGQLHGLPTGEEYIAPDHPYANDLDVFGKSSLFQLINRTATQGGAERLAHWLNQKSDKSEIEARQLAVQELSNAIEWRQHFQAFGNLFKLKATNRENLFKWLDTPRLLPENLRLVVLLMQVISIAVIASVFIWIPFKVILWMIGVNVVILGLYAKKIQKLYHETDKTVALLKSYTGLLKKLEELKVNSEKLKNVKEIIKGTGVKSSEEIEKISKYLEMFEYRQNAVFAVFSNGLFLWDLYWGLKMERWKAKSGQFLPAWFDAVDEADAICSLAGFSFANPDYTFPQISEGEFTYEGSDIGHPLIPREKRITNNFALTGIGKTIIITGSNMSGKSTFQRTLGVNAVLAHTGAPVCASQLAVSSFQVFTSMRTQDSLEESTSSFYAELKRLRKLLDYSEKTTPVFYFLDEILKGTNSDDRHTGAKALTRQLNKRNASGIISTHDLELGKLEDEYKDKIKNYSFNSEVRNGELYFDYKLKEGICNSFNATELMKRIGIEI